MSEQPDSATVAPAHSAMLSRPANGKPLDSGAGWMVFGGFLLPLVALLVELASHTWGRMIFDPIPTWLHVAAIAVVPMVNGWLIFTALSEGRKPGRWLVHLQAFTIGVTLVYTLLFLPMMAFAMIGVIAMGAGLLPLSPFFALWTALVVRSRLKRMHRVEGGKLASWIPGFAGALVLIAGSALQDWFTASAMDRAASSDPATRQSAVQQLRWLGSENTMLSACYGVGSKNPLNFFQPRGGRFLNRDESTDARATYYRVTGRAFDSVRTPAAVRAMIAERWNTTDTELGGDRVAGKIEALSLSSSRMDAIARAGDALAYTEWTMVFKNRASVPNEARAQILLPAGAMVSRLTLWINDEPREAAFGGRGQVRAAYQEVAVTQRRDPVLVTTSGPDRVMMQCFPVPAYGEMKVRMGITAPLVLDSASLGYMALPRFLETNFEDDAVKHQVWVESDAPADLGNGTPGLVLREEVGEKELRKGARLNVSLPAGAGEAFTEDPTDAQFAIVQTVAPQVAKAPERLVLVVDGSAHMRPFMKDVAALTAHIPDGVLLAVVYAGDAPSAAWEGFRAADTVSRNDAARWLEAHSPQGGADNLTALIRAWDIAASQPDTAILWIHGEQPFTLGDTEALLQRMERDKMPPAIIDCTLNGGANRVLASLEHYPKLSTVAGGGTPLDSARALLMQWSGRTSMLAATRKRVPIGEVPANFRKTDRHIVRLWGREEAERLHATGGTAGTFAATKLAASLQLVTPTTGAVVLETKEQYDRHNLQAVDPSTVPVIPEPASALLITIGASTLLLLRRRRA